MRLVVTLAEGQTWDFAATDFVILNGCVTIYNHKPVAAFAQGAWQSVVPEVLAAPEVAGVENKVPECLG